MSSIFGLGFRFLKKSFFMILFPSFGQPLGHRCDCGSSSIACMVSWLVLVPPLATGSAFTMDGFGNETGAFLKQRFVWNSSNFRKVYTWLQIPIQLLGTIKEKPISEKSYEVARKGKKEHSSWQKDSKEIRRKTNKSWKFIKSVCKEQDLFQKWNCGISKDCIRTQFCVALVFCLKTAPMLMHYNADICCTKAVGTVSDLMEQAEIWNEWANRANAIPIHPQEHSALMIS